VPLGAVLVWRLFSSSRMWEIVVRGWSLKVQRMCLFAWIFLAGSVSLMLGFERDMLMSNLLDCCRFVFFGSLLPFELFIPLLLAFRQTLGGVLLGFEYLLLCRTTSCPVFVLPQKQIRGFVA
jgi:hypothetical protein